MMMDGDVTLKTMLIHIPEINHYFQILDKLGEGTFSKVYKARLRPQFRTNTSSSSSMSTSFNLSLNSSSSTSIDDGYFSSPPVNTSLFSNSSSSFDIYALKYIIPIVKPARIAKELRFMRDLRGQCNVIPIKACFFRGGHTVIVMPIIEHDKFWNYFQLMDVDEIRDYMKNLLIALERVHSLG